MARITTPWRILFVLLLPTATAFQSARRIQSYPATRVDVNRLGPLSAGGPEELADIVKEAISPPSNSLKDVISSSATELDLKDPQQVFAPLAEALDSLVQKNIDQMQTLLNQINEAFVSLLATLSKSEGGFTSSGPLLNLNMDPILTQIKETASSIGVSSEDIGKIVGLINGVTASLNTPETIAATAVFSYVVINSILTWGDSPPPGRPYPKNKYDPIGARIFFDRRPLQVLARSLTIASKSLTFALSLAGDKLKGDETWNSNQEQRGLELAQLLTELGPTFIKSMY